MRILKAIWKFLNTQGWDIGRAVITCFLSVVWFLSLCITLIYLLGYIFAGESLKMKILTKNPLEMMQWSYIGVIIIAGLAIACCWLFRHYFALLGSIYVYHLGFFVFWIILGGVVFHFKHKYYYKDYREQVKATLSPRLLIPQEGSLMSVSISNVSEFLQLIECKRIY
jgi:hypothetical protein